MARRSAAGMRSAIRWLQVSREVLLVVAILIGGGWTYFKYFSSESPEAQLRRSEQLKRCLAQGLLDFSITAHASPDAIIGSVVAKNGGDRAETLRMGEKPVRLTRYLPVAGGFAFASELLVDFPRPAGAGRKVPITVFRVLPGRSAALNFISPNLGPGVYVITFEGGSSDTAVADPDCPVHDKITEPMGWFAATTLEVPEPGANGR